MDLRPWHYWTNAGRPMAPSIHRAGRGARADGHAQAGSPRCLPLLHPCRRGVQRCGQGASVRQEAPDPRARRRTPGPHADPHLHAARHVGSGGRAQPACGGRRREVHPGQAPDRRLPDGLLPPQLRCDGGGPCHALAAGRRPSPRPARSPASPPTMPRSRCRRWRPIPSRHFTRSRGSASGTRFWARSRPPPTSTTAVGRVALRAGPRLRGQGAI